jgi:DNA polymerase-4
VILCCRIPEVPIAALILRDEKLRHRPLIVGGYPTERKPVRAASAEARAFGVCTGMPVRQAEQLCPQARFFPVDLAAEKELARHLLAGLYGLAPVVELVPAGEAYVDLSGLDLLEARVGDYLERRLRTRPRLGVAANKFVAYTAAGLCADDATAPHCVPRGSERSFLAPLPLALHLPLDPDLIERLKLFGLRTFGDLAMMPRAAVEAQFGKEGLLALRLARGEDSRPIVPWMPPQRMEERSQLDPAVDNMEPLLFVARGLVDRLGGRLLDGALAATRVRLHLDLDDKPAQEQALQLRAPMSTAAELWGAVGGMLRRWTIAQPVVGIRLRISGFCPAGSRQIDLLTRRDARREDITRQLALLADAHGQLVRVARLATSPPLLDERRFRWVEARAL